MLNTVNIQGRIPSTDKLSFELKNGDNPDKAFLGFFLSNQRSYKKEGEQYYPEDLIRVKAFGPTAIFIAKHFEKGDYMVIGGELRRDDDWENGEGQTVRGEMYVQVTPGQVHFVGNKKQSEGDTASADEKAVSGSSSKRAAASSSKSRVIAGAGSVPAKTGAANPLRRRIV